jgi:hypothetical protein
MRVRHSVFGSRVFPFSLGNLAAYVVLGVDRMNLCGMAWLAPAGCGFAAAAGATAPTGCTKRGCTKTLAPNASVTPQAAMAATVMVLRFNMGCGLSTAGKDQPRLSAVR